MLFRARSKGADLNLQGCKLLQFANSVTKQKTEHDINILQINTYMMRVLVINDAMHKKNKEGLVRMLFHLKYDWKLGSMDEIPNYDLIISSCNPIDTSLYPTKRFIFGPHFSVFPTPLLFQIKNVHQNSIYIQPSDWAKKVWVNINVPKITKIPVVMQPFPLNMERFAPDDTKTRDKVMVYFKRRKPEELAFVTDWLDKSDEKYEYRVFDYVKGYKEEEYLAYLQESKFGIIVDAHESQGFAIEEALSCNVPLLVWNATSMTQEEGQTYQDFQCSSVPYWNWECGEIFIDREGFDNAKNVFFSNMEEEDIYYNPRKFIQSMLSVEKTSEWFANNTLNSFQLVKDTPTE